MTLADRRVVLGVSGGIACYKACTVARRLTELGAAVDVVLTEAAQRFVGPVTFEALTQRPVHRSLWDRNSALAHVHLAREADLVAVVPATARLLARAAQGLSDDLLTAILVARSGPVCAAPAMNDDMYAHPATQRNLTVLRERGWRLIGPATGPLAEGESDRPGRMEEPEILVAEIERAIRGAAGRWRDRRVVVTAGPTRESIDPVRVITNPSSGRMGYAVADAAYRRGAEVTLISGPSALSPPPGVRVRYVESTADLLAVVAEEVSTADLLVMAAAPADYRPAQRSAAKRPRADGAIELRLDPTPDVLAETRHDRKAGAVVVGFALETDDGLARARAKLEGKALDLVVLNSATEPDAGFESTTNRVTLVTATEARSLPLLPKSAVAEALLDAVEPRLP